MTLRNRRNRCIMAIRFSRRLPGRLCGSTYDQGLKSWMESGIPDNCHQKSFPITCQAFRALRLTAYYPYRIKTWHPPHIYQRWFNWDDLSWNPHCVCFSSTGLRPLESQSKNTQSSHIFKLFQHLWGPRCATERNVRPNTVCKGLSGFMWPGAWPTMASSKGGERRVWCFECDAEKRVQSSEKGWGKRRGRWVSPV